MNDLSSILYAIGQDSGIVAIFTLGALIFSGDTARFWDRFVGLDKIIKFQKKFSYFVAIFVVCHPVLFILSQGTVGNFLVPSLAVWPLALGIVAFYLFTLSMLASYLYKRISYYVWQYIHVVNYMLFGMALSHAFIYGSDAGDLAWAYILMMIFVAGGIVYRTKYKLKVRDISQGSVLSVNRLTEDTFELRIKVLKPMQFRAGQFCFLRLNMDKLYARHPFTITNAPGDDVLAFSIKRSGRFTRIAEGLKEGDKIMVDGPFGVFTPPDDKQLVLVAGGVGIAPFMSIIRDRIQRGITQPMTLFYASKTKEDIIFHQELASYKYPWLKVIYVLSNDGRHIPGYEYGYISKEMMSKHVSLDNNDVSYYLCGPEGMKRAVIKILRSMNINRRRIFKEDFFW